MGVYLSKPSTDVELEAGSGELVTYVAAEMQGWRKGMEDDHIAEVDFTAGDSTKKYNLFAVFDGHGGKEVAIFSKFYFVEELIKRNAFHEGNYQQALEETFLQIDTLLDDPKNEAELAYYRKFPNPSDLPESEHHVKTRYLGDRLPADISSRASVSSDDSSTEKKKVTSKQAVELLTKLLKDEVS